MSYGFEILTTDGLVDVTTLRAARLYQKETFSSSGADTKTATITGFDISTGFYSVTAPAGKVFGVLDCTFNNTTKVFSISNLNSYSFTFTVTFYSFAQ